MTERAAPRRLSAPLLSSLPAARFWLLSRRSARSCGASETAWRSSAFSSLSREIPSPAESFPGRLANGLSEKGVGFPHKAQRGVDCAWINLFDTEGLGSFTVCEKTFHVWIETSNGVVLGCENVLGRCPGLLKTDLKFSPAALVGSAHTDKKIRILKGCQMQPSG